MKTTCAGLVACVLLLGACRGPATVTEGEAYPTGMKRGPTLDIQVIRHETEIQMTNTTAHAYGPSRLWINGRFSHDIPGFAVGQTLTLRLSDFKDRFGESFKGGGFFATERSEKLALAELQSQEQLLGLVVISVQDQ